MLIDKGIIKHYACLSECWTKSACKHLVQSKLRRRVKPLGSQVKPSGEFTRVKPLRSQVKPSNEFTPGSQSLN